MLKDGRLFVMRRSNRLESLSSIPPRFWRLKPLQWLTIDVMDWLFPFCAVNLLWVLLSLTFILFPPATASLFEVGWRAYRGQAPTASAFLSGVSRWMVPAWKWAGPNLILVIVTVMLTRQLAEFELVSAVLAASAALILLAQVYVWPYIMLQEAPHLGQAVRNSLFTVLGDPIMTGMNLAITALVLVPSLIVIVPILLILPVVLSLLYTYTLVGWLAHHDILPETIRDN